MSLKTFSHWTILRKKVTKAPSPPEDKLVCFSGKKTPTSTFVPVNLPQVLCGFKFSPPDLPLDPVLIVQVAARVDT